MSGSSGAELERLAQVMSRLRSPGGCPWDREQDLRSLRPYLLEEAYEVLEEMDRVGYADGDDWSALCEELGDLLFQIVFHAELARERGAFDLADVSRSIADKLVRRHPHVFGDKTGVAKADTANQVLANWAVLKAEERKKKTGSEGSVLQGVPDAAPALMRAERLTEKASRVGFDWPDVGGARDKLTEELAELDEAMQTGDRDALEHELGDVLLSVVNLSRFLKTPPEDALRQAMHRFTRRFQSVEAGLREANVPFGKATLEQMEAEWRKAKAHEGQVPPPRAVRARPETEATFPMPRFEPSQPWRDAVFAQLGFSRDEETDGVRYGAGSVVLRFVRDETLTRATASFSFHAPTREALAALRGRLLAKGLDAPEPTPEAGGAWALVFTDPSGTRWRYATR